MAVDNSQSDEVDLDRTDRLPILTGVEFDDDVEDDAVRMDYSASLPGIKADFPRPSPVDLPSLADSVRSVEERIARQAAEYEALNRSYENACAAESAAVRRAESLAADMAGLRASLEAEQRRATEADRALEAGALAATDARSRSVDALRDAERHQAEAQTLRQTLAARDTTIAQVLHSLGERDAQFTALQHEHAQMVPALQERSHAGTQLAAELQAARQHAVTLGADLEAAVQKVTTLNGRVKQHEAELTDARRELGQFKAQASTYLERLRTREWRRGYDHNTFRELDGAATLAQQNQGALQVERDRLRKRVAELESTLSARDASISALTAAADELEAAHAKHEHELQNLDGARSTLVQRIAALETERDELAAESESRNAALREARAGAASEGERFKAALAELHTARESAADDLAQLLGQAKARDEEVNVLMAHLREARKPMQSVEAEMRKLTDEVAAKTLALEGVMEENRTLRLAVERTRGALEEREFLIRRLERSESNNANVLGRIQTSIERLGSPGASAQAGQASLPAPTFSAELARVDGHHNTSYTLLRRTRIGRAPGCELQIESSSVSRHHALLVMGQREVVIEDLNSTNGVLVNGRKVSRQLLNDGDMLTIGEAQFRFNSSLTPRAVDGSVPRVEGPSPQSQEPPKA